MDPYTERRQNFRKKVGKIASKEKEIILSLTDKSYIDMAFNFYETSIVPLGIENMLFIVLSNSTCIELDKKGMNCFAYSPEEVADDVDGIYGSDVFKHKMNMRARFVIDALNWGYKVLLTDLDVIFFKNPLEYFMCDECDIECLEDGKRGFLNAGFLFLRPTEMAIKTYQTRIELGRKYKGVTDQSLFNQAVKLNSYNVKIKALDQNQFPCGKVYFETFRRHFGGEFPTCAACVMVHNNWIVGKEAKVYRFKESHLWVNDRHGYYSNQNAKYLVYDNPLSFEAPFEMWNFFSYSRVHNAHYKHEIKALANALSIGKILNRIVILPKFHNYKGDEVPLTDHLYISNFDNTFSGHYREHSFLVNPRTASNVRNSKSNVTFAIHSSDPLYRGLRFKGNVKIVKIKDPIVGATSEEIINLFSKYNDLPVLRFHNLYGAFSHFEDSKEDGLFKNRIKRAFIRGNYRQYL